MDTPSRISRLCDGGVVDCPFFGVEIAVYLPGSPASWSYVVRHFRFAMLLSSEKGRTDLTYQQSWANSLHP